jgi:hypothetical protein
MAINRIGRTEFVLSQEKFDQEEMTKYGWCATMVPVHILEQLGIVYQLTGPSVLSRYSPARQAVTPAWVYAVWFNSERRTEWDTLKPRLAAVRNNPGEQEMLCSELSLNLDVPRSVRTAARHFVERLQAE